MARYGYGGRPLWQWVVIYLVIGGVIYYLIYYFVLSNKGGYNYSQPSNNSTQYIQPSSAPQYTAAPATTSAPNTQQSNPYKY